MHGSVLGNLYIKKRSFPEWLTVLLIILPLFFEFFISIIGLPSAIKYISDAFWIILLFTMFFKKSIVLYKNWLPFFVFTLLFFTYTFIIYLFNFQSPIYYLWGLRNNFRYYVFFFALLNFYTREDTDSYFKLIDLLFWINAAVTLVQYLFFGFEQDFLGGIFGIERGANSYTIIFFIIVTSKALLSYMSQKESAFKCFSKCGVTLFIAALAELKVYYVLFLMVLGISALITRFSWKKFVAILICVIAAIFGSIFLTILFDFDNVMSISYIWELATQENYSAQGTVNRLSAIPTLAKTIVTEFKDRLFGLGLGNCDTSSFAICNTPFYQTYGDLRYSWFSCAFLFLETGYIGLIIFLAFFVICYILSRRLLKSGEGNPIFCQMAMIMAVTCIVLTFYNSSLRTEAGYIAYFILALPFIRDKGVV